MPVTTCDSFSLTVYAHWKNELLVECSKPNAVFFRPPPVLLQCPACKEKEPLLQDEPISAADLHFNSFSKFRLPGSVV